MHQCFPGGGGAELPPFRGSVPEDRHHVVGIGAGQGGALDLCRECLASPCPWLPDPTSWTCHFSVTPSDPTQSRTEPCRHSQEHSYYKLPRSTKGDIIHMCQGWRVAPGTKSHSAKAFKAKQGKKGSEGCPREGTAYAKVLSPQCWGKNKPRGAAQPDSPGQICEGGAFAIRPVG